MARANEVGAQCAVLGIAIDPGDQNKIVVVVRRVGGSSAFRSVDDGHSWTPIADVLTRANPQLDLTCAAIHPALPDVLYLGARAGRQVFVSTDGGVTWPRQRDPGGMVTQLIVDRASGADWHTATLYAATDVGFAHSTDGGDTWSMAGIGEVTSLAVYMPLSGSRRFYAGVYGSGLYYADAPAGPWQNLFGTAAGLPAAPAPHSNLTVLVDYCPRQPDRVYAMVAPLNLNHGGPHDIRLFVSTAAPPSGTWVERGVAVQPPLDYYLDGIAFLVAPENAGPDTADVLFCSGGIFQQRSTDGGRTWQPGDYSRLHHTDTRSLDHYPPKTSYYPDVLAAGSPAPVARIYVGSDGGIAASRRYSDPTFNFAGSVTDFTYNAGATHNASAGLIESLNHGLSSVAAHQFASNADPNAGGPMSLIGYVTALDTGGARRVGSPVWANSAGGDGGVIFVTPAGDGVRLWLNVSANIVWPVWNLLTWVDRDPGAGSSADHVVTAAATSCGVTSNMVPASPGDYYAGIIACEQVTTLSAPVTPDTGVVVIPVAMTPDFVVGARICLGDPTLTVFQPITSVGADRFTVTIYGSSPYPAGTAVRVVRSYLARVTGTSAAQISQVFIPQLRRLYRLAQSGDSLLAASADQRLWLVTSASTAGSTTTWTEVTGRPADLSGASIDGPDSLTGAGEYVSGIEVQGTTSLITSLAADAAGAFYVMLSSPVPATAGGATVNTPLFRLESGAWVPESTMLPATAIIPRGVALGKMVAHPTLPGRLFVARNARVFRVDSGTSGWAWTDLSDNLPGQEVHDLWIGNIAPAGAPARLVLRATTAVRGVWELELGSAAMTTPKLYFRDHAFDPGWLGPSVDGIESPLHAGLRCWHWQSADIKVDTPLLDSSSTLYYQNDPEAATPTAGDFAWFKDRSQVASAGTTARIWVRVNNRSPVPTGDVSVWAITTLFGAALAALPSGFWSRFHSDGTIDTALPPGAWSSLGLQTVSGVQPEAPGIAGFTMSTGALDDHRCIVAFVHGPGALLDTAGLSLVVDEVVPAHPQICQRNVLVSAPLPAFASTPAPIVPEGVRGPIAAQEVRTYIEFNNPRRERAATSVKFDLGGIPAAAAFEFRLSRNALPQTITGARRWSPQDGLLRFLWILLLRLPEFLFGYREPEPGKRLPLSAVLNKAPGGGVAEVSGIALERGGKAAAELVLRFSGNLSPGEEYHMDVLQLVSGQVTGGATIRVPVTAGK